MSTTLSEAARPLMLGPADFERRDACPCCGSRERRILSLHTSFSRAEQFPMRKVGLSEDVARDRRLYGCSSCGLWYLSHVPERQVIQQLLDYPEVARRWPPSRRHSFARTRAAIERLAPRGGAILDIGAQAGYLLDSLGPEWEKYGLDPLEDSTARLAATGVKVIRGYAEEACLPAASFECVTALDVLEHLRDPDAAAIRMAGALKPGGILIVETGATESLGARLWRSGWYYLGTIEHFQAFSRRALMRLFGKHGLRPVVDRLVAHSSAGWRQTTYTAAKAAAYAALTVGRRPQSWRYCFERLAPGHNASPPGTFALEPDHRFMVLRKESPV